MADTSDDVQAVLDAEDRRYRAMVEGDLTALDALLAPGMTYTHSSGRRDTKDEYLDKLRSRYYVYRSAEHPVERVEVSGDAAVVVGRMTADVDVDGVPKELDNLATAVWTRADGDWRLLAYASSPPPR
ncbi:nuclear transport factor 2 family protein [Geodermatophilus sp. SYSU D00697]